MSSCHQAEGRRVILVISGVICLALAGPARGDESSFDGVYRGQRVRMGGSSSMCSAEEAVSVTIKGYVLTFTNSRLQNMAIGFNPDPDGSFKIAYAGFGALVFDPQVGDATLTAQGRINGDVIDADVINGPCTHHWHLIKEQRGQ
jgi:hypothetical protein